MAGLFSELEEKIDELRREVAALRAELHYLSKIVSMLKAAQDDGEEDSLADNA